MTVSLICIGEQAYLRCFAYHEAAKSVTCAQGVKIEDLTTGTGYLRKQGWLMRMSFEEKIGGSDALKALQTYAKKLYNKYGSRAFNRFRKADMKVLSAG